MVPVVLLVTLLVGKIPRLDVEIPLLDDKIPLLDVEIPMLVRELPLLVGDVLMPGPQEMDEAPLSWSNISVISHGKPIKLHIQWHDYTILL